MDVGGVACSGIRAIVCCTLSEWGKMGFRKQGQALTHFAQPCASCGGLTGERGMGLRRLLAFLVASALLASTAVYRAHAGAGSAKRRHASLARNAGTCKRADGNR